MIEKRESITAKLCSFVRAYHSIHDRNKVFDDYLAFDLMGSEEYFNIRDLIQSGKCGCDSCNPQCPYHDRVARTVNTLAPIPLSREAFTHDVFKDFLNKHPKCQYVICGAGMDSFLFRNDNPNITIFEVDHPDTQRYKQHRISELGWIIQKNINFVPVDFSRDDLSDKLLDSGFDPNLPTFFTILGVTYYLTLSSFEKTIELMDSISAVGSIIILDYPDNTTFDATAPKRIQELTQMTALFGETMTHGFTPEEMQGVFERHHCKIQQHINPADIQEHYFSHRNDGMAAYDNVHLLYAEKVSFHYASKSVYSI